MDASQLTVLATSVASLITAGATLLTVLEMKRQRRSTYLPELLLTPKSFQVICQRTGEQIESWSIVESLSTQEDHDQLRLSEFTLQCVNVGRGSAKNVRIEWVIDIQEIIFAISDPAEKIGIRIWNDSDKFVSFEGDRIVKRIHHFSTQRREHISFVQTAELPASAIRLRVPPVYLDLLALYLGLAFKDESFDKLIDPNRLSAQVRLRYEDIEGAAYTKQFQISPDLSAWGQSLMGHKDVMGVGEFSIQAV
jgi:hypothetical protein